MARHFASALLAAVHRAPAQMLFLPLWCLVVVCSLRATPSRCSQGLPSWYSRCEGSVDGRCSLRMLVHAGKCARVTSTKQIHTRDDNGVAWWLSVADATRRGRVVRRGRGRRKSHRWCWCRSRARRSSGHCRGRWRSCPAVARHRRRVCAPPPSQLEVQRRQARHGRPAARTLARREQLLRLTQLFALEMMTKSTKRGISWVVCVICQRLV